MYAHTLSFNMCSPSRAGKPGILLIGWLMVGFLVLADKKIQNVPEQRQQMTDVEPLSMPAPRRAGVL